MGAPVSGYSLNEQSARAKGEVRIQRYAIPLPTC